jgi:hypothetical protein
MSGMPCAAVTACVPCTRAAGTCLPPPTPAPPPTRHDVRRYIVDRGDAALWDKVLDEANSARKPLIEQVWCFV